MPILPAPLPFDPAGGDLPVSSSADVLAALPRFAQGATAPVRDAVVAGIQGVHLAWQSRAAYAAAQADPLRATGIYLDGHLEDRGLSRGAGEGNEAARTRMLATSNVVTPDAITAAADAILAPFTSVRSQLIESILDRLYISDGTGAWHSFIGTVDPGYPDRYYADRPQSSPGAAWVFGVDAAEPGTTFPYASASLPPRDPVPGPVTRDGRYFVLRVPVLIDSTQSHSYVADGTSETKPAGVGMYVADGTNAAGSEASGLVAAFVSTGGGNALDVYQSITNAVEQIRGHGVRWMLFADPLLTH